MALTSWIKILGLNLGRECLKLSMISTQGPDITHQGHPFFDDLAGVSLMFQLNLSVLTFVVIRMLYSVIMINFFEMQCKTELI